MTWGSPTSVTMLEAIAVDRKSLTILAKDGLGLDTDVRPKDAIRLAALYLAWQSAGKRVSIQEMDAEASTHKVPKSVPPVDLQLNRKEFEKAFYKLKDGECPGKPSFEDLCEQMDQGEFRAMALRHFGSRNEDEEAETGNLLMAKSGHVKIKKAMVETTNPGNMEEFRTKIMLMINHFIFARYRYPHRKVLDGVTYDVFLWASTRKCPL